MPTATQVTVALLAAACLVTGFRCWRWERRQMRRIAEYRSRLPERMARAREDAAWDMRGFDMAMYLIRLEDDRRARVAPMADALLEATVGLHIVREAAV